MKVRKFKENIAYAGKHVSFPYVLPIILQEQFIEITCIACSSQGQSFQRKPCRRLLHKGRGLLTVQGGPAKDRTSRVAVSYLSCEFTGNQPWGCEARALLCSTLVFLFIMSKIHFEKRKYSFLIFPSKISYTALAGSWYLTEKWFYMEILQCKQKTKWSTILHGNTNTDFLQCLGPTLGLLPVVFHWGSGCHPSDSEHVLLLD